MAHKIFVKPVPHINKDGSESASKKNYEVWDRTRNKTVMLGRFPSKKAAEDAIPGYRDQIVSDHMKSHPNDIHFQKKHGVGL